MYDAKSIGSLGKKSRSGKKKEEKFLRKPGVRGEAIVYGKGCFRDGKTASHGKRTGEGREKGGRVGRVFRKSRNRRGVREEEGTFWAARERAGTR